MLTPVSLRPEMGRDIVRHLSQFADLPAKGILAGQAVDSAITDLWSTGGGVYNDLDIFRQCPYAADRPERKASVTAMRSHLQLQRQSSYGSMALVMETMETYGIASVSRKGMLNHVNCFMASGKFNQKLTAQRVLSGFDINCVRVGVDLESGLLYWDKHYLEFQQSRQLKIAMMHTPWHTFVRLAKKLEELPGVYADMDIAAQACASVAQSQFVEQMLRDRDVSLMFGSKQREVALGQASILAPYFEMESCDFVRRATGKHSSQTWREAKADDKNVAVKDRALLWKMRSRGAIDEEVQGRIDKLGKGCLFFAYQSIEESRRRKSGQIYVKLDALRSHREEHSRGPMMDSVLNHLNLFETAYVEGQALPAVSDKVEAFFQKHSGIASLMLGLSLAEQWAAIQRVKKVTRKFANEYLAGDLEAPFGVLETQATATDLLDDEGILRLLTEDHKKTNEPFNVEPLKLPAMAPRWSHYKVEELLTALELQREGARMHHCVAGYAHAVRSGRARILRIRNQLDSKHWSTAELRPVSLGKDKGFQYELVQHRAKSNKNPHAENEALLSYVVTMLNMSKTGRKHFLAGTFKQWASVRVHATQVLVHQLEKTLDRMERMSVTVRARLHTARNSLEAMTKELKAAELCYPAEALSFEDALLLQGAPLTVLPLMPNDPDDDDDGIRF